MTRAPVPLRARQPGRTGRIGAAAGADAVDAAAPARAAAGPGAAIPAVEVGASEPGAYGLAARGEGDRQFVTALARGLMVLDCFSAARPSLGVSEVAGLLGLPQPTVWRLCHTLVALGYLAAEGGRLHPTLAVLRLGYTVLGELPATSLARPHLQAMADRFGAAAGVAVREGEDMVFVERCEGRSQLLMNLRVGSRVPLATSALGWACLAGLPDDEREAAVAASPAGRRAWRTVQPAFARALAGYRRDGFLVNDGTFHPGYSTAAAPVLGPDGRSRFALNCGGASSVLPADRLHAQVGPMLARLARSLGSVA